MTRYRLPMLAALLLLGAGVIAALILTKPGVSAKPLQQLSARQQFLSTPEPVPSNQVTGNGAATVALRGDRVTVTLDTNGLLNGSPHAMHIHAGGAGVCPPASAAHLHDGHLAIDTKDGLRWYGPPQASLTESGDTSARSLQHSILAFHRYPATGAIRYKRTFVLPSGIATAIRSDNAVVVVHGIDYNHNGLYDDVLGQSQLNPGLPGEATAPALCGALVGAASASTNLRKASHGTIFVAALHLAVTRIAAGPISFALFCHLVGVTGSGRATDPRATPPGALKPGELTAIRRRSPGSTHGSSRSSGSFPLGSA